MNERQADDLDAHRDRQKERDLDAKQRQAIPIVRHTRAAIEAAEVEVIAAVKALYGQQHEPGAVWVREAALKLLDEKNRTTTATAPMEGK